ncbi:Tyrosine-protein phosphatase non-receptor type 3, partial [Acipenser ruthenus]
SLVMNSRLRVLGGRISNIRVSELPKDKNRSEVVCNVHFLDGTVQSFKVNKQDAGQVLLDMVYNHLGLIEREYFSLQHNEDSVDSPIGSKLRWLEPTKPIRKQLKGNKNIQMDIVCFWSFSGEMMTGHLYFLQLKNDILEGRVNIMKISFKRKRFFIQLRQKHGETREHNVAFSMLNYRACKNLWKSCVEHHTFFQAKRSLPQDKKLLSHNWTLGYKNPAKRSPRLRHNIRKPRHSSMDNLESEMTYITETEDVFYTYKESPSSKDSDTESSWNHSPCRNFLLNALKKYSYFTDVSSKVKNELLDAELLLLRITPDAEGRFGFNVKGGVDQKMPLVISRVSPDSPADLCTPKLVEGDQIVLINGRDISEHTHDQVVMFIKASRESHTKELVLLVKRKDDNTRVVLDGEEDNYINANFVNMEIPSAGIVNKYVASQGPLPHTCSHFWQAVWEQHCAVIVMLTTLTERGKPKCHQYWPDPPEVKEYGNFQVCCHSEDCNIAYVFRELTVTNIETREERSVTHLQYVAWPDHGVPDDPADFLDFVNSVRQKRVENEPLFVHCSAGIGRTGVLVTMETSVELIEKNQPVYPLDIVRTMRDQRAMMVQTVVSTKHPV